MYCTICKETVNHNEMLHTAKHYKATKFHCNKSKRSYACSSLLNEGEKIARKRKLLKYSIDSCTESYKKRNDLKYHKNSFRKVKSARMQAAMNRWICNQKYLFKR